MALKDETISVLERKLAAARDSEPAGGRSALRALRLAIARAAADELDLAVSVIGATQARRTLEDLTDQLAGDRMHVLLDGPSGQSEDRREIRGDGRIGALCLDRSFVTALTQHQTMGQVSGGAPDDRPFTDTDAAMTAGLVDAILARSGDLVESPADQTCLRGYRFGARAEDSRTLLLALEEERYRIFNLTLDIAAGVQQGTICLILPEVPDPSDKDDPAALPAGPRLDQGFGVIRAELMAVVCRLKFSLAELAEMKPGDALPLAQDRLDQTELLALDGQKIAVGRLGQSAGMRAIRLNETAAPIPDLAIGDNFALQLAAPASGVDGNVQSDLSEEAIRPGLPVPYVDAAEDTEAGEPRLFSLNPEQAAAEISELAGLPLTPDDAGLPEEEAPIG